MTCAARPGEQGTPGLMPGLRALFVSRSVLSLQWNGMFPLLPVFGLELGVRPSVMGVFLAGSYAVLIVGMLVAGRWVDASRHGRAFFVAVGVLNVPAVWLVGLAATPTHLLLAILWAGFLQGAGIACVGALAGQASRGATRGRVFTILAIPIGLGAFLGGMVTGPAADAWGFPGMFLLLAALSALCPIASLFLPRRASSSEQEASREAVPHPSTPRLWSPAFVLLLGANTFALTGRVGGRIGTSIVMDQLGFTASWISATAAISGLVALPFLAALGPLSDRFRRGTLLAICYLFGGLGLSILPVSTDRWHFLLSSSLLSFLAYASTGIGSALATDLAPWGGLGRAVSLFTATSCVAGVVGSAAAGFALEALGPSLAFGILALFALLPAGAMWLSACAPRRSPRASVDR